MLVFVQCCKQVKYLVDLFKRLRIPTPLSGLYGTLNQLRRMAIYKEFCEAEVGVMVATDIAARGLGEEPLIGAQFQSSTEKKTSHLAILLFSP